MRYFLVVAEELHFSRAAARLNIAQPALSQHVLRMEREIGASLFDRTSRSVRLTAVGEVFRAEAARAVELADRAVALAQRAAHGSGGELRIGVDSGVPRADVVELLRVLRADAPDVRPEVAACPGGRQVHALRRGDLHLGLVWAGADERTLGTSPFRADVWGVAAAASSPLWRALRPGGGAPWAAVVDQEVLLPDPEDHPAVHRLVAWLSSATGLRLRAVGDADPDGGLALAAAGYGAVLAPGGAVTAAEGLPDGSLRWEPLAEVAAPDAPRAARLLAWPAEGAVPAARRLRDALRAPQPAGRER